MISVGLKQFRVVAGSSSDSLLSYCVYDPQGRDAIFIDPHLDAIDEYVEFISSNRLKPNLIVETQRHSSHPSASRNLKSRYGCPIGAFHRDQESVAIGPYRFQIFLTPGTSQDACILAGERLLFSGNTLWIGSSAPQGFPGSNTSEHFQSLKKLAALTDGDMLILPAFDSNDLIFSTLAVEKSKNIALRKLTSREEFNEWSRHRTIAPDEVFKKIYEENAKEEAFTRNFSRIESAFKTTGKFPEENADFGISVGAISPEKYALKLEEHASSSAFLDVREREEYLAGHMPKTESLPWIEVGLHLAELKAKKRIYVSCLSGRRSNWVSRTLSYLGFQDVVNVSGGLSRWQQAGLPIEKEAL